MKNAIRQDGIALAAINDYIPDELILDCKHSIIKGILNCMKEGRLNYVEHILTLLSNYALDWPELGIIKRSFEHEIKKQS